MKKRIIITFIATLVLLGLVAGFFFFKETKTSNADYYYNLAQEYVASKDYDKAMYNANKAIEIDPSFKDAYKIRNHINLVNDDFDALIEDFEKLIDIEGGDFIKYRDLSTLYQLKENYEKALYYADLALNEDSEYYFFPLNLKAMSLFKLGEFVSAKKSFYKAYEEILGKNKRGLNDKELIRGFFVPYSLTLEKLENANEARNILTDALKYHQDSNLIYERLGFIEASYYGNKEKSLNYFKKAKEFGSNQINPEELVKNLIEARNLNSNF